jgi:hypothetical protein
MMECFTSHTKCSVAGVARQESTNAVVATRQPYDCFPNGEVHTFGQLQHPTGGNI